MTVPFCRRMPPCRDSLRQIAAIPGQISFQSVTVGQECGPRGSIVSHRCPLGAAGPARTVPGRAGLPPGPPIRAALARIGVGQARVPASPLKFRLSAHWVRWAESLIKICGRNAALKRRSTRANLVSASCRFKANSSVFNILLGIPVVATGREPISRLVSNSYDFSYPAQPPLTPYSRIFCRQASTNQQVGDNPCKIFKTRGFNLIAFQYIAKSRLQDIENRDFISLLFSEVFHHGRQNL